MSDHNVANNEIELMFFVKNLLEPIGKRADQKIREEHTQERPRKGAADKCSKHFGGSVTDAMVLITPSTAATIPIAGSPSAVVGNASWPFMAS